jgi:hypothetical protein
MPHVIKRIVNALERSSLKKEKRDLRCSEKQPMTLRMIQLAWEATKGASLNVNGCGLTKEHFIKDACSRMRVKLSMQVLSNKAHRMMVKALNDPTIQSTVRSKHKLCHTQFYRLQHLMVHVNNLVDIVNGVVAKTGQRAAANFTPETGLSIQKALLEILEFFSKWEKSVLDNPKLGQYNFFADETWTGIKRMTLSYVGTIQHCVIGLKNTIVPKRTTSDPCENCFARCRSRMGSTNTANASGFNAARVNESALHLGTEIFRVPKANCSDAPSLLEHSSIYGRLKRHP